MINISISDKHKMLVEGLSVIINASGTARVTNVSHTLSECRKALTENVPDIILTDIYFPDGDGTDFIVELKSKYPGLKIIILTRKTEPAVVKKCLNNGANGYISKNADSRTVLSGINKVFKGKTFLCSETKTLIKSGKNDSVRLSAREKELLTLIAQGYTSAEIAEKISLSVETIKTYRKNLIVKLGAKNSATLVRIAFEQKLI